MIHIKLGERRNVDPDVDVMNRKWVGYDEHVPKDELFEINGGRWVLGARAKGERYAAYSYTGDHKIKFVVEITGLRDLPGGYRRIEGRVLDPKSDPVARKLVESPAPDQNRNPVTYHPDPAEVDRPKCACRMCGIEVSRHGAFVTGHDQKAIHARIHKQWGDTLKFIDWFDDKYGTP